MRSTRVLYNPFIVLSDVTISTLVILACLLMLFSACIGTSAKVERRKQEQARQIQGTQERLFSDASLNWPSQLTMLNARGLQSYLCRFPENMFDPANPARLSNRGHETISAWAQLWGERLRGLEGPTWNVRMNGCVGDSIIRSRHELKSLKHPSVGSLIEIQVQGHCSPTASDAMELSLRRAMAAADILQETPGFPVYLVSVSGHSWYRRAFLSTDEAAKKVLETKPALQDRIDILLIFAGDQEDNNFVAAWDGRKIHGPLNDVSVANLMHGRSDGSGAG